MDKIKNVLSGHKKSEDATHDSHTSSSTATGEQHPIYDEMTGHQEGKEGKLTAAGGPYAQVQTTSGEPYTTLAQPSGSIGHGHNHSRKEHVGTDGPIGSSSTTSEAPIGSASTTSREPTSGSGTTSGGHLRPDANPTGRDNVNTGMSGASIKSGVIGFGAGERQGHAALSTHNPTEQYMDRNQVVGGGDPGTAAMTEGQNLTSTAGSQPLSHSGTTGYERTGNNVEGASSQQPYENTLRQQSYTADTDRSFPLAGGVASRQHPHEHTSPTQHQTISEREPGTKEKEVGVQEPEHEGHGREELAGAAAAGTAGGLFARHHKQEHKEEQTAPAQHQKISEREPGTKEKEVGVDEGHGRKGLIGGLFSRQHEPEASTQRQTTSEREPETKEKEAGVHEGHGRKGLIGGLFSRQHEPEAPTQRQTISEREPGTKEREVGVHEGHGREGLVGAAAATTGGLTSRDHEHQRSSSPQHATFSEREPVTQERDFGAQEGHHEGHGREGLAGAAAAATAIGASKALPHSEQRDIRDQGLETRQATYGDVPPANYQSGDRTTGLTGTTPSGPVDSTTGSTTHHHNPAALAAATTAASRSSTLSPSAQEPGYGSQDRDLPGTSQTATTGGPTSQTFSLGALDRERPHGNRTASHRHVPGEFPSPTPGDESRTFLDYGSVVEPTSNTGAPSGQYSTVEPTSTTADVPTSQHELRHTGSLEQPQSRSSDVPSEHHYGRDAALAGGLGAGAAGLGTYAASQKRETPDVGSKPLYEETSPYSSKTLDPRVLGTKAKLEEQRFDPETKSETLPHHAAQTSNPSGISATSGPTASHGTAKTEDPQHHYGRDAALVGAGAATAGGLHHSLQRNDTPGTGTAVLPQDSFSNSQPYSSSNFPQQSSNSSAPQSTYAGSVPQQRSTGNDTFYGTSGAPAPVVGRSSPQQQPLSNLGHTSTSGPSAVPEKDSQHHYGRDATLVGAGAATAVGLYAANRDNKTDTGPASSTLGPHDSNAANVVDPRVQPDPSKQVHHNVGSTSEDPASKTIGPHKSNIANILDPRVKPDPSKQKGHTTTGPHQSDTLNRADPKVDEKAGQQGEHHYGRDAAVVGGTGAAGYGAYEAMQAYGEHRSTGPGASMNEQRYDPSATGAKAPSPVPTQGHYNYNDPNAPSNLHRNEALGTGAGLGAAGAGAAAYAGSKHADNTQDLPFHQKQNFASSTAPGSVAQSGPTQGTIAPHNTQTQAPGGYQHYDPTQDRSEQHHDKRDAALLGTAGAAAAGGGAYAYSQHQDTERERARLEHEQQERLKKEAHDREKEQHRLDKEQHKHEKEASKLEKEQHKHDKEIAAAQHKHEKDVAAHEKEQHRLEKEEYKREKEAEKEAHRAEKEHEGEEKKKGGLLGFLHRDKSKKEKKDTPSPESSPRHSKEYAAAGTAGALGVGTTAAVYDEEQDPNSPRWKGRNLLHKDPPPGHPAREALEQQQQGELHGGKREHIGVDGPIGDPNLISGDRETSKGVYGAHDVSDVSHQNTTVIEPTTGLPMNVGKFGAGTGGTDANPNIEGYHQGHGTAAGHQTAGHQTAGYQTTGYQTTGSQGTADREAIRKADTPY